MNISLNVEHLIAELPRRLHEVVDEQAAIAPRHPAVVDHAKTLSFEELRQATIHASARLGELGVRGGDRVMVVSENCVAAAVLLLALSRLDAWVIIVNPRLSQREVEQIREHSGARLVLFTSEVSPEAATHAAFYNARSALVDGFSEVFVSEINSMSVPERVEDEKTCTGCGFDLHIRHNRNSEGRHAHPREPPLQRAVKCALQVSWRVP